ncbi:hypothetical protein [Saccharothrix coeruleofusca]|uniref:Transmembrane protein n=1 Tax=Saccharothrix coeruleofusca TaxID=33919 RepID=A0A918ASL8_9PSEU|nr:hypothetical protein [Saccharothrix coeruleofusca]MBP2339183.1 hypothetical protein [Saccharothrix coeruleofusca]GGP70517.1 hypothetical protein GCM10010185_49490 [Saccharothrix coeruleofusca]
MDTRSIATVQRNRRMIWGGGVGISLGLIGLPLVLIGVWPGVDHSPWDANTMILATGVALCAASYISGRIAVVAATNGRVSPPTRRPYLVAGISLAIAVLSLLLVLS